MEDKRRRLYEVIVYDEYIDALYYAQKLDKCKYYWINHDQDKKEDGTLKDKHFHLLLYFNDGITLKSLCKKLQIEGKENKVSFWSSNDPNGRKDYRIRYLIHYKNKDENKHEYLLSDIHTNDTEIEKYFNDNDSKQSQDILLLFDYFDSRKEQIISYRTFLGYVYEQGLWGTYQRNAMIFNRLLDEHNETQKEMMLSIFENQCYNKLER